MNPAAAIQSIYASLGPTINLLGKSIYLPSEVHIEAAFRKDGISMQFVGSKPIVTSTIVGFKLSKPILAINVDKTIATIDIGGVPDMFDPTFDLVELGDGLNKRSRACRMKF